MMSWINNPWPYGKEHCVECGTPCSRDGFLCEKCGSAVSKRSRKELHESVKNGTFDTSGEIARDIAALHGNKQ